MSKDDSIDHELDRILCNNLKMNGFDARNIAQTMDTIAELKKLVQSECLKANEEGHSVGFKNGQNSVLGTSWQNVLAKKSAESRIDELKNIWASGRSLHKDIRVGYERGLTVHERIYELESQIKKGEINV